MTHYSDLKASNSGMTAKQASKPKRGKELDRELNTRTQKMTHQGTEMAILI